MECYGETIDGIWETNGCECEGCLDAEVEAIERDVETGAITEAEAWNRYAHAGLI